MVTPIILRIVIIWFAIVSAYIIICSKFQSTFLFLEKQIRRKRILLIFDKLFLQNHLRYIEITTIFPVILLRISITKIIFIDSKGTLIQLTRCRTSCSFTIGISTIYSRGKIEFTKSNVLFYWYCKIFSFHLCRNLQNILKISINFENTLF